jgi:hypothetical protein
VIPIAGPAESAARFAKTTAPLGETQGPSAVPIRVDPASDDAEHDPRREQPAHEARIPPAIATPTGRRADQASARVSGYEAIHEAAD